MRILKSHPFLKLVNSYLIDSPQPSNLSYLWNFGSLLAVCLIIQIITGVTLAMHYNPSVLEAFNSVEHIMRDVNNGWLIRYLHSNTASAFFFLVYLHIGKGMYYGSYKAPRTLVWTIGTIIFVVMMATAFLGYDYSPKWYELSLNLFFFSSPLELLLQSINVISNVCLLLLFIFSLQLFYKFYVTNKPKLSWLESIFSSSFSDKIRIWTYKIINLNKNMSIFYRVTIIVLLIVTMFSISYASFELISDLKGYVQEYMEINKK